MSDSRSGHYPQLLSAASGIGFVVLLLVGFLIAGLIPPPPAYDTVEGVAGLYRSDPNALRTGLLIAFVGAALYAPFTASTVIQLARVEGPRPVFTMAVAILGAAATVFLMFPMLVMLVAVFRPDRSPADLQLLHDVAWILLVAGFPPFFLQLTLIGVVILRDDASDPILPRWTGYFSLWAGFAATPGAFVPFFKSGPLAWQGAIAFWMVLAIFGAWFFVMFFALRGAVDRDAASNSA